MLKHIVFWRFADSACGLTKQENMDIVKEGLLALMGKVASLRSEEVGQDVLHSDASYDMCLICTFDDMPGFIEYRDHPEHQKVLAYIKQVITDRKVIDYYFGEQ